VTAKISSSVLTGNATLHERETDHLSSQRHSSRRGQPELKGEKSDRRAAIWQLRVEEARDYLDLLISAQRKLRQVRSALSHSSRLNKQIQTLGEVAALLDIAGKDRYRIEILEDARLAELNESLRDAIWELYGHISQFARLAQKHESIHEDVLRGMTSEKDSKSSALIFQMQVRINRLRKPS